MLNAKTILYWLVSHQTLLDSLLVGVSPNIIGFSLVGHQPIGDALLYNEWNASLGIDDTGANTSASYTVTLMIPPSSIKSIDYSSVALQGNTEIKLINNSASELVYGFGNDSNSFAGTQTVYSNTQKRQSATSLGYNALSATKLNVQNNKAVDLECTIEFYDMG